MKITDSAMVAIKVRYIPATNTRPSRLCADAGMKRRVVISYDSADSRTERYERAVRTLCDKMGWTGDMLLGWHENGDCVAVFTTALNP